MSDPAPPPPRALVSLLAASAALVVANLYYGQPLAGPIARDLGLPPSAAGLVVTLTQIGYGLGLVLLAPLGDLLENRRLIVALVAACGVALGAAAVAGSAPLFLAAMLAIGLTAVAVQVLVPFAAHVAPPEQRGRVVGDVMGGLMLGIMLARPAAGFLASAGSWRVVFGLSAGLMAALAAGLWTLLPERRPTGAVGYAALIASLGTLFIGTPVLRRRAVYQGGLFGAFSLFWTTTPLLLAGPDFRMSSSGIALFALVGVAGAVAAPIAGRWADRGLGRAVTMGALVAAAASFWLGRVGTPGTWTSLGALVVAAILLDFCVSANLVVGQRAIFSLGDAVRGRLNGLFIACFFLAGAAASALGGWAFARGGWPLASALGSAMPLAALAWFLAAEPRDG